MLCYPALIVAVVAVTSAPIAKAQSSVTIYGLLDEGLDIASNARSGTNATTLSPITGGHRYALSSGIMQGNRWGVLGSEDLGGGIKAVFRLENGFDLSTGKLGQGGNEFGRQAYVGLADQNVGTLTIGRQYDSIANYAGFNFGQQLGGIYATRPGDLDNGSHSQRINNAIKFTSTSFGGFKFSGLYSFGGVAGSFSRDQIYSMSAGYTYGPLAGFVGYLHAANPNISFFGNNPSASGVSGNNMIGLSPLYGGYASADTYAVFAGGVGYHFPAGQANIVYTHTGFNSLGDIKNSGPNQLGYSGNASFNSLELNFTYNLTSSLAIAGAYDYTSGAPVSSHIAGINDSGATYNQVALAFDYVLSKRTDVYLQGVYQHVSGNDSTGKQATAQVGTFTASTNNRQLVGRIGLRHRF
nr:porin [Burkholderia multivorans]